MVKCNFSCIQIGIEEEGEPVILCQIKKAMYPRLPTEKYGYWKCDEEECIFQRILDKE